MHDLVSPAEFPSLHALIEAVLQNWPRHLKYLKTNFSERDADLLRFSERLAGMILALADDIGGLERLAADYRFICEGIVLPEELHFRRTGEYRLQKFEDAIREVYSNKPFMTRYMNGLLATDVLWINHCKCMQHYAQRFLPSLPPGASLLEVGPGHGLLLNLASKEPRVGSISGWDISLASLEASQHSLKTLSPDAKVRFELRNLFDRADRSGASFDAIVFSEVLEHMEDPAGAIRILVELCNPGGKIWVNVPANSPAPDHLYLVRSPQQAVDLLRSCGLEVVDQASFATSGTTLKNAIEEKLTISCVVVGQTPN